MKRVSIFFIISFLFFLSCDDKKDDDNPPFSIIGSWNYFYLSNEDWVSNNIKWDFRNDGRIYLTNGSKFYYYYCNTKNYLSYSNKSVNESCDCINSSTLLTQKLTFEGSDTFFMTYCNENSPWVKFER